MKTSMINASVLLNIDQISNTVKEIIKLKKMNHNRPACLRALRLNGR